MVKLFYAILINYTKRSILFDLFFGKFFIKITIKQNIYHFYNQKICQTFDLFFLLFY